MRRSRRRAVQGFVLIEVLVAVLIMSFGMLGIASLLLVTTRSNTSSIMKQQAIQTASNMVDRIRANRAQALLAGYDVNNLVTSGSVTYPSKPSVLCDAATCSAAALATYDVWAWLFNDVKQLPLGTGRVVTSTSSAGNTTVAVTVQWDDSPAAAKLGAAASSPAGADGIASLTVTTLLQ